MFIRRAFANFHEVHSDALPRLPAATLAQPTIDQSIIDWTIANWTIDWRWVGEADSDDVLPSEGSLINWPAWARPTTPRHA